MRCEDLARELASPTGAHSPAEVAGHLAACPACAGSARPASSLDRAWEATRPAEPSMDALDALWARASAEIDARRGPAILPFEPARRARRRWAVAAFVAAQAAAVLVAALVLTRHEEPRRVELADAGAAATRLPDLFDLNVEADELAVVRIDKGNRPRVEKVDQAGDDGSSSLPSDTPHEEMNAVETADFTFGTVAVK